MGERMIPDSKSAKKLVVDSFSTMTRRKKTNVVEKPNRSDDDPMRVALLCPYSMSVPGGVQNQVLLLSTEMRKRGIDARIIAPCDGVPPTQFTMSVGSTRRLKSNGSLAPIVDDAQSASLTLDAISSFGPDIIHLHEPLVPGPTTSAMIGAEVPMVATFHAAGEGVQALKYFRHPARGAVSRIHQRVAVSEEAHNLASQYLPGDYTIIPNCVDVDAISKAQPWPATKPTVFFVGRHEERKGLRYLVQAWLESEYCQNNAALWIAGVGDETAELTAMTSDDRSVSFLGRIDNDELFRRMRAADIVVAPALYGESFGIILLEAMAAGAAVIASNIPGYRDVARDGVEAILTTAADSSELAGTLEKVLRDSSLREDLIDAGYKRVKEFSVQKVVTMYADLYAEVIRENCSKID
jgi:phosphatidylinositol alpha-mannosyltransferase